MRPTDLDCVRRELRLIRFPDSRKLPFRLAVVERHDRAGAKEREKAEDVLSDRLLVMCAIDEDHTQPNAALRERARRLLRIHHQFLDERSHTGETDVAPEARESRAFGHDLPSVLLAAEVVVDRVDLAPAPSRISQGHAHHNRSAPLPGADLGDVPRSFDFAGGAVEQPDLVSPEHPGEGARERHGGILAPACPSEAIRPQAQQPWLRARTEAMEGTDSHRAWKLLATWKSRQRLPLARGAS